MKIVNSLEAVEFTNSKEMITDSCRVPDHSLLTMTVELSTVVVDVLHHGGNTLGCKSYRSTGHIYRKVGDSYMSSDSALRLLPAIMAEIEETEKTQTCINECCEKIISFILDEAKESVANRGKKRKTTKYKEYWDNELMKKWNIMKEEEQIFRRLSRKGPSPKSSLQ